MKKSLKIILIIIALLILGIALAGMYKFNYLANQDGYDADGNKIEKEQVRIVNQASEFCIRQGGTLEIEEQTGYCKLKDGEIVEEWEYFLAERGYNKYKTVSELKKDHKKIEDAKTCEVDSDCVVVPNSYSKCNFGCVGLYVNKNKVEEISKILEEKFDECKFDCMNVEKEVKCIKNKCELIYKN